MLGEIRANQSQNVTFMQRVREDWWDFEDFKEVHSFIFGARESIQAYLFKFILIRKWLGEKLF